MSAGLNIDGDRLWSRLMNMALIGATEAGGSNRQSLSDDDADGRALFVQWCEAAGCTVDTDDIGNLFARRPGSDPTALPVVLGSHLDTQPTGGRFDGVYGVLGGLEVVESLNDHDVTTIAPIEIAVWTNEEGSRFPVSMMGSAVWADVLPIDEVRSLRDVDSTSVGDELDRLDWVGGLGHARPLGHYLELHIEQGPVLETSGNQIGVVAGVQGFRWFTISLGGHAAHAGPTPMDVRRDPARPLADIVGGIYRMAEALGPAARATPAQFRAEPVSPNTVPSLVEFSVDLRNPDAAVLASMEIELRRLVEASATNHRCEFDITRTNNSPPVHFDERVVATVNNTATQCGFSSEVITSGAGHDACNVAPHCPTGMIFVPCKNGLSHNEAESIDPDDASRGVEVLYGSTLHLAGVATN